MDLMQMLKDTKGGFATIVSRIEKKGTKKSRLTGESFEYIFDGDIVVEKTEYVNIKLSYEASVNRQRDREDKETDFVSEPLPWGEWVIPNLVIVHKGEYYLRYYEDMNCNWDNSDREWFCGKRPMDDASIARWKKEFGPLDKEDSGRQEVDKAVKPRTVKFRNIVSMKFDKKEYVA